MGVDFCHLLSPGSDDRRVLQGPFYSWGSQKLLETGAVHAVPYHNPPNFFLFH